MQLLSITMSTHAVKWWILGLATLLTLWIFLPFLSSLFVGMVIASSVYPFYISACRRGFPKKWIAMTFATAFTSFVLIYIATLFYFTADFGIKEATDLSSNKEVTHSLKSLTRWFNVDFTVEQLRRIVPLDYVALRNSVESIVSQTGQGLANLVKGFLSNIPQLTLGLLGFIISFYSSLLYGERALKALLSHSMIPRVEMLELFDYFSSLSRFIVLSSIAAGVCQVSLMVLTCLIAGLDNLVAIAMITFFFSFVPYVGTFPISIALITLESLAGNFGAVIILATGSLVIGISDNIIRSAFLSRYEFMPGPLAFLAILGALIMIGPSGIILGPVIVGLLWKSGELFILAPAPALTIPFRKVGT